MSGKRALRVAGALIAVIVVGVVLFAVYLVCWTGPSITIEEKGTARVVDLRFLGEYCIGVRRLQLRDATDRTIVWDVIASDGVDTHICMFELRPGVNAVRVDQPPEHELRVIVPPAAHFRIESGRVYELRVWGNNGFARWNMSKRRIRF